LSYNYSPKLERVNIAMDAGTFFSPIPRNWRMWISRWMPGPFFAVHEVCAGDGTGGSAWRLARCSL